jgi:hypothetical protein
MFGRFGDRVFVGDIILANGSSLTVETTSTSSSSQSLLSVSGCAEVAGTIEIVNNNRNLASGQSIDVNLIDSKCIRGDFSSIKVDLADPCLAADNERQLKTPSRLQIAYEIHSTDAPGCLSIASTRTFAPLFALVALGALLCPL